MSNLRIYEAVRTVPPNALKEIQAGRLKGKSDINPMWRIRTLTEQFGPCGIGWKYEITEKKLERGANEEVAAFVDINLYVKVDGEWSAPIPGTGGSAFVAKETNRLYVSDECFKMALTDAISVSCKALGFAADVYWEKDGTKYSGRPEGGSEGGSGAPGQQAGAGQAQSTSSGTQADTDPLKKEIRQMLWAMSYENKDEALSLLEQFTRFTKDGKDIPGKTDINKISDKQLPVTHKQVTEAYKQWRAAREKENDEAAEAMVG